MSAAGTKIRRRALGAAVVGVAIGTATSCRSRSTTPADGAEQLRAVAEAVIGLAIEPAHYEQYFRARLARDAAARDRYQQILARLPDGRRGGSSFVERPVAERRRLLDRLERELGAHDRSALRALRRESLALFSRTDAWIHLGYDSWPGTARGFDGLAALPAGARRLR